MLVACRQNFGYGETNARSFVQLLIIDGRVFHGLIFHEDRLSKQPIYQRRALNLIGSDFMSDS